jgi:hypothetical protein
MCSVRGRTAETSGQVLAVRPAAACHAGAAVGVRVRASQLVFKPSSHRMSDYIEFPIFYKRLYRIFNERIDVQRTAMCSKQFH